MGRYNNEIKVIIIYGELFGGLYSHPDEKYMAKDDTIKPIQKGLYYSPELHFYAFDIKTDLEMNQNEHKCVSDSETSAEEEEAKEDDEIDGRLSVKESIGIFEKCGFLHAKILEKGNFNQMMRFNADKFQSTIPKLLNLPPPVDVETNERIENIAEGIVIRPLFSKEHILLKIKSQRFLEITGVKPRTVLKIKSLKIKEDLLAFADEEFCEFVMRCINDQRLQAVESKVGRLNSGNFQKIKGMFVGDVFEELEKEQSEIIEDLQNQYAIDVLNEFIESLSQTFMNSVVSNEENKAKKKRTRKKNKNKMAEVETEKKTADHDPEFIPKLSKSQKRRRARRRNKAMRQYVSAA